jgi:hypothetical protein
LKESSGTRKRNRSPYPFAAETQGEEILQAASKERPHTFGHLSINVVRDNLTKSDWDGLRLYE